MRPLSRLIMGVAASLTVAACTPKPIPLAQDPGAVQAASCRGLYATMDAQVDKAGVGDAQFARIAGYPYLRIDRFLAADDIKPDPGGNGFVAWVERLRSWKPYNPCRQAAAFAACRSSDTSTRKRP